MNDKVSIKIPRELYDDLRAMTKGTGFASVTAFVTFTMQNVAAGGHIHDTGSLSEEEVTEVRDRLRRLGYL